MARASTRIRDLILGLLFFGVLIGLGWITTQLRNVPGVGMTRQYLNVLFEDVYGVRREDPVQVYGTRFGRVSRVEAIPREAWDRTGRGFVGAGDQVFVPNLLVVIELERDVVLHEGYRIHAEDANLLGGKVLTLQPGEPEDPDIDPGTREPEIDAADPEALRRVVLVGTRKPISLHALGDILQDNKAKIDEIIENVRIASGALNDENAKGMLGYVLTNPDGRQKAMEFIDAAHRLALQTQTSGNIVNDLFYGSPLRDRVLALADNAAAFAGKANDPNTLLGSLVAADAPYRARLDSISANLDSIVADARRPGSLVSRITADGPDSLGAKADDILGIVRTLVKDAKENPDSLIHQAVYGDLGRSINSAAQRIDAEIAKIGDALAQQTGVLGWALNNPDSRRDIERLIKATLGIIEDAREAAPVSSIGSFIFGGF
jgi:ABC-type transporter Mla subunit MlaD